MVKILEELGKISQMGMSKKEKQSIINVNEVWSIWNHLVARYDIIEMTQVLYTYCRDDDFKLVIDKGLQTLEQQTKVLEDLMEEFGIPLPLRPPKSASTSAMSEIVNDRYIFRRIFRGIQAMLPEHVDAFTKSTTPKIRAIFKEMLIKEMSIYDNLIEYGKVKGWLTEAPVYRT